MMKTLIAAHILVAIIVLILIGLIVQHARAQNPDPAWMLNRNYTRPPITDFDKCVAMGYRGPDIGRCIVALSQIRQVRPAAPVSPGLMCDTVQMDSNYSFTDCF